MLIKRITRGWVALLCLALAGPAWAGFNEAEDVKSLNGDPSPTKSSSRINDYTFQDEQLNLKPTDGLVKVLRTDQKININDFQTVVLPIKNVGRREIRNIMRQVTGIEGGRAEEYCDKRTNESFVQVIAPAYMIPYLRAAVKALDEKWVTEYDNGSQDIWVKFLHRDAVTVDYILRSGYAGTEGWSSIDTTNNAVHHNDEIWRNEAYLDAAKFVDIPPNQVEIKVRIYEIASANDMKLGLDYVNWKNGPGRTLFLFAEEGYHANQNAKGATSVFDPFIDARSSVVGGPVDAVQTTVRDASYRAANYLLTANFVDFLQTTRQARVINEQTLTLVSANTGKVSTQDQVLAMVTTPNVPADVKAGPVTLRRLNRSSVPDTADLADGRVFIDRNHDGLYTAGVDTLLANNDWPTAATTLDSDRRLHYQNAGSVGMNLNVTPYVGIESMELVLQLNIGDLNGIAPNGLPIINTRTVATTVRLLDGQPFVIAGIKRSNGNNSTAKMPWVGSIPGLGWLAGGEQSVNRESEVVITIEPHFLLASQHQMAPAAPINETTLLAEASKAPALKVGYEQFGLDDWMMNK